MIAYEGQTYTPVLTGYDTGRADSLTVRVVNLVDDSTITPGQAGVVESAQVQGTYRRPDMPAIAESGERYLIIWEDSGTGEQMTEDLQILIPPSPTSADWAPSTSDVGQLLLTRTKDRSGNVIGDFTADTLPTGDQVETQINQAVSDLQIRFGTDPLPAQNANGVAVDFNGRLRRLAALRTAMYVELIHFPEQVRNNQSAYAQYKQLYDESLPALIEEVSEAIGGGGGLATGEPGQIPQFSFPDASGYGSMQF